jgi:probable phosphoglycerate mutase
MLIHLARHGETEENATGIFQGQWGRGLNARGRVQAQALAERMRRAALDAIVASDLDRAAETARIVATACGLEPTFDAGFREVDVGLWTGKSHEEVAELYPEELAAWGRGLDVRRGGGETYAELAVRVEEALARVVATQKNPDARLLVVSHGGAIKAWVARLLGLSGERFHALAGLVNAAVTLVEWRDGGRARLERWNDASHLEAESSLHGIDEVYDPPG